MLKPIPANFRGVTKPPKELDERLKTVENKELRIRRASKAIGKLLDDYLLNDSRAASGGIANLMSYFKATYHPNATAASEIKFIRRIHQLRRTRRLTHVDMMASLRLALEKRPDYLMKAPVVQRTPDEAVEILSEEQALEVLRIKERIRLAKAGDDRYRKAVRTSKQPYAVSREGMSMIRDVLKESTAVEVTKK